MKTKKGSGRHQGNNWPPIVTLGSRLWLPDLNPTTKWHKEKRNLKLGDIVIVMSPDSPRAHWPLAKVMQVFPGKDGKVRVAQIRMGQKLLKRPVNKLCLLEDC